MAEIFKLVLKFNKNFNAKKIITPHCYENFLLLCIMAKNQIIRGY